MVMQVKHHISLPTHIIIRYSLQHLYIHLCTKIHSIALPFTPTHIIISHSGTYTNIYTPIFILLVCKFITIHSYTHTIGTNLSTLLYLYYTYNFFTILYSIVLHFIGNFILLRLLAVNQGY
jgi:hypothetical protein